MKKTCNCSTHRPSNLNLITRRGFLDHSLKVGLGVALSTLLDIPPVLRRALAEGHLGDPGPDGKVRKLLFVFLRGANDGLNSLIPIQDPAYGANWRPDILIPKDTSTSYGASALPCDFPESGADGTFTHYPFAIRLGNGFAALHPSLKFLAPVYNAGHLALIHRVGYPRQSRSHFDSQAYWETGDPNNNLNKEGILYRTILQSGYANLRPVTAVSIQSSLPLILRGSEAALTNLSSVSRYDLLNIPIALNTNAVTKADLAIQDANAYPFPTKASRDLLALQYQNLMNTLPLFKDIAAQLAVNFRDDDVTDGDTDWANANGGEGYSLFPTSNNTNGGYLRPGGSTDANKYVVDTGAYNTAGTGFFNNLKAAALVLNKTGAIIAGTEFGGFDTHQNQGGVTGTHANLNRRIAWMMYALRKYFTRYADQCDWDHLTVVTLSEFGRTTVQNSDDGTDHAEAGVVFAAGGSIRGYGSGGPNGTGVFGCHTGDAVPWTPASSPTAQNGSMFGASSRYLKRFVDYRSVLGETIRWLGATQTQLNDIIRGYATEPYLLSGGDASDGTPTVGHLGFLPPPVA